MATEAAGPDARGLDGRCRIEVRHRQQAADREPPAPALSSWVVGGIAGDLDDGEDRLPARRVAESEVSLLDVRAPRRRVAAQAIGVDALRQRPIAGPADEQPVLQHRATIVAMVDARTRERTLRRIREICLALPETSERLSHGAPTFFVRDKRAFLMVLTNHHGDGRFAIWCAAPDGMQKMLVEADPERFFVPPYVGHRGWLGVRLDRPFEWEELTGIAEDAYAEVAPASGALRSGPPST